MRLAERIAKGPIKFRVVAQLANDGDIVNDATQPLACGSDFVRISARSRLTAPAANDAHEQQWTIFDPDPARGWNRGFR